MNTKITGRHIEVTDAMRNYVAKRIAKLSKYYNRISEMEVIVDGEGLNHIIEIIVRADNHQPFVVRQTNDDAYAAVDAAVDKIERQLTRFKEKSRNRKRRTGTAEVTADILQAQEDKESEPPA